MAAPTAKEAVAQLIRLWVKRSGLQKQQVAARADFGDYDEFYRAYLDRSRPLSTEPAHAIGVVRAFSERLSAAERCTAEEAVRFLILTRLPLDGFEQIARLGLFPPDAWRAAVAARLSFEAAPLAEGPAPADLRQALAMLEQHLGAPPPAEPLAAAEARLAELPIDPAAPPPALAPLPAVHRLPFSRNPLFQGRAVELHSIAVLLKGLPAATGRAVALAGLGGVGKTSLALEFAHRYGPYFAGGVFWLSCADPRQLPSELIACGQALFPAEQWHGWSHDEQLRRVRAAFSEPIPRLLIFDMCEDEQLFASYRPITGGCRLLLTSRRASWPPTLGITSLPVGELTRAHAVALLRSYRPDLAAAPALDAICALLGDLPLALHLAGSYLERYGAEPVLGDPARLLDELRAAELLEHEALASPGDEPASARHAHSVAQTFAVSLDRLDPARPADNLARTLLARAGWLAPGVPFERALLAIDADRPTATGRLAARAIRRLRELGLVELQGQALRLHPLVAAFARRLGDARVRLKVERTLAALGESFYHTQSLPAIRALLPHLRLHVDTLGERDDDEATRLNNLLALLIELALGDTRGALPYLVRARELLERKGALATPFGAAILNNLGISLQLIGDSAGARQCLEASLHIRAAVLSPDDRELAESHNNLGELLREQGSFAAAEEHALRALAILGRAGAGGDEAVLATHNNLALLVRDQGRYGEAALRFAELLVMVEAKLGAADPRAVRTRHNLGDALRRAGELTAARAQLQAAIAASAELGGDDHPDTMLMRHTMALLTADEGDRAAARGALGDLTARAEELLGADHPVTRRIAASLRELA